MAKIELDDYTINGRSISTIETWIQIPELNVCFDIGKGPRKVSGTDNVLISHFHQDHALGITKHIATRNLLQIDPPRVFVPQESTQDVHRLMSVWEDLEERRLDYKLQGVQDGDEYQLRKNLKVRAFKVDHSITSYGYTIIEERQKLRQQYLDLDGEEIVELKEQGEDLFYNLELPLVTYTGDSRPNVLDRHEFIQNSRVLITESTFLKEGDRELAQQRSHTHLQDLIDRKDQLQNNYIVLVHFSARYTRKEVFEHIQKQVPADMQDRIRVLA
jgi:ribonuclease Z